MPDTIMIYNGKYYVLDAKCYKYGWTGIPDHLPNGSSINKQITYGEYLEKHKGINADSVFNAFIMTKGHGKKGRPPGHHDKADAERRADGDAPGNGYLSCIHPGALPACRYQPHNIL